MRIADYQVNAYTTAIHTDKLVYPALGLAGEVGEVVCKMINGSSLQETGKEVGDVLWYLAAVATDCGLSLDTCVNMLDPDANYFADFEDINPPDAFYLNEHLSEYAGVVCECVKKTLRDDGGELSHDRRMKIQNAIGEMLRLLSDFALECGTTLAEVAQGNLDKLASRAARGTITGDGDNR